MAKERAARRLEQQSFRRSIAADDLELRFNARPTASIDSSLLVAALQGLDRDSRVIYIGAFAGSSTKMAEFTLNETGYRKRR